MGEGTVDGGASATRLIRGTRARAAIRSTRARADTRHTRARADTRHTRARAARGLPRDQRNIADTAGQYCLGSRSRPRAVSGAASVRERLGVATDRGPRAAVVMRVRHARSGFRARELGARMRAEGYGVAVPGLGEASGWGCPQRSRGNIAWQYRQYCAGPRRAIPPRASAEDTPSIRGVQSHPESPLRRSQRACRTVRPRARVSLLTSSQRCHALTSAGGPWSRT